MTPTTRNAILFAPLLALLAWAALAGGPRPDERVAQPSPEIADKSEKREEARRPVPASPVAAPVPERKAGGAEPAAGPEAMEAAMRLEPAVRRVEALVALVHAARTDPEREMGLRLLSAAGDPEGAWKALREMFREGSPELALAAMEAMLAQNPPVFLTEMADALTSLVSPERQVLAVRGLREASAAHPPARMPAASTLAHPGLENENREVRRASLEALGDVGNRVVVPRLREYAGTESDPDLSALALTAADRSEGQ